jgi:hypothetical protein
MSIKINYELAPKSSLHLEQKNGPVSAPKTQTFSTQSTLSESTDGKELVLVPAREKPSRWEKFISAFIRLFSW